jgi:predicted nuclease of predicted toxin-antitoxin system
VKILLDECLPLDFRHSFPHHEAQTVQWAGLKSKKKGELLRAAENAGYDVFLTIDQGIPHQQESPGRKLAIIVIRSKTNQIEDRCCGDDRARRSRLDSVIIARWDAGGLGGVLPSPRPDDSNLGLR